MSTPVNPWTSILGPKPTLSTLRTLAIGLLLPAIRALIGRIWTPNLQHPESTGVLI